MQWRRSSAAAGPVRFGIAERVEAGERRLRLRGELDLAAVPELRERVRRAAARDGMAILDLADVEFADVAGLSALTVLAREARDGGWRLELRSPSLAVRYVARLMGMDQLAS